tara:strand:- start:539 stop:1033 length:495 start_codon:yes stop_codon:yes gene_type:complete
MASELRVDKIVPVDGVPSGGGGGIVQVKQIQHSISVDYSTNSFSAGTSSGGNFAITITPKFATSKILLSFTSMYDLNAANQRVYITMFRSIGGGTASNIVGGRGLVEIWNPDSRTQATASAQYLDSPNTTQQITYTIYAQVSSGNFYLGLYNNQKWMQAMEVSA